MRKWIGLSLLSGIVVVSIATAQPPGRQRQNDTSADTAAAFVKRMMTFDANQDGQLSKDEVTDRRLLPLFERADVNGDGIVTKDELIELQAKEPVNGRGGPDDGPEGRGPGPRGFGGPGGPGGPGGRRMGPPPIGEILPPQVKDVLGLTNAQRKKLDALQQSVKAKLDQILTEEQKQQLEEMRRRGPGGRGGPGEDGPPGPPPTVPRERRGEPSEKSERPQRPEE